MIGNTLSEFVDDILTMGGPEKEFLFRGKKYMLQCQKYEANPSLTELVIFECFGNENYIFRCLGKDFRECFEQFENVIGKAISYAFFTFSKNDNNSPTVL